MLSIDRRFLWGFVSVCACALMLVGTACEDDDDDEDEVSIPVITPNSVQLPAAVESDVVFTVTGGAPDYSWTVLNPDLGTLTEANTTAIYKSKVGAGQNIITVTDANSNGVSATITQL